MRQVALAALVLWVLAPAGVRAASAVVNSEIDAPDPVPGDGICDTGFGPDNFTGICTLRAAFQTAQAGDQITFAPNVRRIFINFDLGSLVALRGSIDGGPEMVEITSDNRGAYAITVSPAHAQTNPITIRNLIINGFAGDGIQALANIGFIPTNTTIENCYIGTDRTGMIAIGNGQDGIVIAQTLNTTIRNCVVSGNARYGINVNSTISGPDENTTIVGCKVGTDVTGAVAIPNGSNGVNLGLVGGGFGINPSGPRVGGILPGEGNVISGNLGHGVFYGGDDFQGEFRVQGNFIGVDATGTYAIPNGLDGIAIERADDAIIGGPAAEERNVISGNALHGISIGNSFSDNHLIQGNYIGPDATGEAPIGNGMHGVYIHSGALNVTVGENQASAVEGPATGELGPGNLIAFNGGSGIVSVQSANQGMFRRNRIHSNGEIGIDLGGDGPTPNGTPTGVNFNMPFPIITSIVTGGGTTTITGTVSGFGGVSVVDFYRSELCDPSGFGEGGIHLGTTLPPVGGNFMFQIPGEFRDITATMTSSMATSEFAPCGEVMVVNTIGDLPDNNPGDGICSTGAMLPSGAFECTLRAAIEEANADPDHTIVRFGIRDEIGELILFPEIAPQSALPDFIHPVTIDGTTQRGEIIGTGIRPNAPQVEVPNFADVPPGPVITGGLIPPLRYLNKSEIRGIAWCNFTEDVLHVENEGQITIEECWFGFDPRTNTIAPNTMHGIRLLNSGGNVIGSAQPKKGNLFAGANSEAAINIEGFRIGFSNRVIGNFFGTNPAGSAILEDDVPTRHFAVAIVIHSSGGNFIGMPTTSPGRAPGNLIGGAGTGILISNQAGAAINNTIQGNRIGLDSSGNFRIPNEKAISLFDANPTEPIEGTLIGGPNAGDRNLLTGNHQIGIELKNSNVKSTVIQSNYLGTSVTGFTGVSNLGEVGSHSMAGILVSGAKDTVIGGKTSGAPGLPPGNVISDSGGAGIAIGLANATIQGNVIGLNSLGDIDLGNGNSGISLVNTQGIQIGGDEAGEGNLISGNALYGIFLHDCIDTTVQGNAIGPDISGAKAIANFLDGIHTIGGRNLIIGGAVSAPGEPPGNHISGNHLIGISIDGASDEFTNVRIEGNLVGTQRDATKKLDNRFGMEIRKARDVLIYNNVIAHNDRQGIAVFAVAGRTRILSNRIFSNKRMGIDIFANEGSADYNAPNANDPNDGDIHLNTYQNYPVIQSALRMNVGGTEQIKAQVSLNSTPNSSFLLQFYGNAAPDKTGFGEGSFLIHEQTVTTDANGNLPGGTVEFTMGDSIPPALFLTATATGFIDETTQRDTSEFSRAVKITGPDSDGDGIPDAVENAGGQQGQGIALGPAPMGYDGNSDGTPDATQPNVASFPNAGDGRYVTLAVASPAGLFEVAPEEPGEAPPRLEFPYGLFNFRIADADGMTPTSPVPGGFITADLYLPDSDLGGFKYWKLGHSPVFNWYEFVRSGGIGPRFDPGVVHLDFIDGQIGDDDLSANGSIFDPGGPALILDEPSTSAANWVLFE